MKIRILFVYPMRKMFNLSVAAFMISLFLLVGLFSGCELINGGGNDNSGYPVVLLHGFLGWGRDELGGNWGHYHMGGYHDIQELIKASGSDCYTAVVGPFSSNWDRACELYAQLKGKRTDYGLVHSIKHKHERYGKDWTGKPLLEKWGEPGQKNQKIHIIAHSYGAQTARTLAQLLATGCPDEYNAVELYKYSENFVGESAGPISPLFDGTENKDMIHSITTVAGTNNGTTLANNIEFIPGVLGLIENIAAVVGVSENETSINLYDFKLQQFGIFSFRQPGESVSDYFKRMRTILQSFVESGRDNCLWDLSPEGAREINGWVRAQKNIYYFSFTTRASQEALLPNPLNNWEKDQLPDSNVHPFLSLFVFFMGRYTSGYTYYNPYWLCLFNDKGPFMGMPLKDRPKIDSSWWRNDGVVNTVSQKYPWLYPVGYGFAVRDKFVNWNKTIIPIKGVWNWNDCVFKNVDHWDSQGLEIFTSDTNNFECPEFSGGTLDFPNINADNWSNAEAWYVRWAEYLKTLN